VGLVLGLLVLSMFLSVVSLSALSVWGMVLGSGGRRLILLISLHFI